MNGVIRIGTRDSELALWQADFVKGRLEATGYHPTIVPIISTGDLIPDKPLYELGITGIFTKSLDLALLRGDIDIAVHSLKDVPTVLPKNIVQAAVLRRGNFNDLLVYRDNEEFLAQERAIIATGSLRRRAQWLNRYPTHTVVGLRGNVNTRMDKLRRNNWNGAIFAAAGLERIGLKPKNAISLGWMLPAPGQGAIMIASLLDNLEAREACKVLNHEDTATCTTMEREFLHLLEGGCTAPIGALAYIKNNEIHFKGVLLNEDGTKKIEVSDSAVLGKHQHIAGNCAGIVLKRGGKRLMHEFRATARPGFHIYSTKKLTHDQLQLFNDSIRVTDEDFIKVNPNRIPPGVLRTPIEHVVITSKNAVEALLTNVPASDLQFGQMYCVGRKTKRLVEDKIGKVKHTENTAIKLAEYLVEHLNGSEVTYFCSNVRLDDLPAILTENGIKVNEIMAYSTKYTPIKMEKDIDGVLFFSPSAARSFILKNKAQGIAFCIGESTASEASTHFSEVRVAKIPTVEDLISLVNSHYNVASRASEST